MNLNPFSHNYLNQLPTSKTIKGNSDRNHSPYAKSENKPIAKVAINHQQQRYRPSNSIMTAQFALQPRYMKCSVQYTKEGYFFTFLRKDNTISGRSLIIFPEGIVANCNVVNSKLSGWIVICKKGQFYNISHYTGGKLNGLQFIYDLRCNLTIQSVYHCGKLQSVKRGVADSQLSFERCLKNKDLVDLLQSTQNYELLQRYLPKIQSPLGNYYGSKSREMPNGLGVLITESQCFYGNFKKGLLSEEGVMIFSNGNTYIGQFQEGMMKGYGNFIKNGIHQFKQNNLFISQVQFNAQRNISSFYQSKEIADIFYPIVRLYMKLKVIYENRRKDPEQNSQSFVDVQIDNSPNQEQQEQANKQSDQSTPRGNILDQLVKTTSSKQYDMKNSKSNSPFTINLNPTPISFKKPQRQKDTVPQSKQEEGNQKSKQYGYALKRKKDKTILRDQQWQQIIQELDQGSINKQDGFLKPNREIFKAESHSNKKSGINSRVGGHSYMGPTDNRPEAMDRLQNHIIGKIINKN